MKMRKVFIFLSIFTPCLILTTLLGFFQIFKLKKIIIISNYFNIQDLEVFNNQNILLLDQKKTVNNLLQKNSVIKSIVLTKRYPNTIILSVDFRKPAAIVTNTTSHVYVDSEGIILPSGKNEFVPTIEVTQKSLTREDVSDWRIKKALELLEEIRKQSISIVQITVDDTLNIFRLQTENSATILVPFSSEASSIATSLQVIMSRFRIEGKFVKTIDFRFDKPVAILTNGEKNSSQ